MIDVKKLYFSYTDKPFVENVSFHAKQIFYSLYDYISINVIKLKEE